MAARPSVGVARHSGALSSSNLRSLEVDHARTLLTGLTGALPQSSEVLVAASEPAAATRINSLRVLRDMVSPLDLRQSFLHTYARIHRPRQTIVVRLFMNRPIWQWGRRV